MSEAGKSSFYIPIPFACHLRTTESTSVKKSETQLLLAVFGLILGI